jgi:hypothetical protein
VSTSLSPPAIEPAKATAAPQPATASGVMTAAKASVLVEKEIAR